DVSGPNDFRDLSFQYGRDDEVRRVLPDGVKHRRIADGERDVDNMSALSQFDRESLTKTVMRGGQKKYLHRSLRARYKDGAKSGFERAILMWRTSPPPHLDRPVKTAASGPLRYFT